jgi:hypothetical protein
MRKLLNVVEQADTQALLACIFNGREERTQDILRLLGKEERTQIKEALEIAANVIDPEGHDCRDEEGLASVHACGDPGCIVPHPPAHKKRPR